ncbi:unnamed protein product [Effrenium voratum]|nr:unnamed protein product [Effrenium voratum]
MLLWGQKVQLHRSSRLIMGSAASAQSRSTPGVNVLAHEVQKMEQGFRRHEPHKEPNTKIGVSVSSRSCRTAASGVKVQRTCAYATLELDPNFSETTSTFLASTSQPVPPFLAGGLNSGIHRLALADQTFACGDAAVLDTATRRRRDIANNPYTATGVTAEGYLTFTVDPIQALEVLTLCVCVPPPGGSLCSASSLSSYHQSVGVLDVRGAQPGQSFTCGRGGRCTLDVAGRGLSALDRAKIVNFSTDCTGEPQEAGFFKSLLIADPAPATSSTSARFSLGQVTAGGVFKVCYCASLDACNSLEAFNHQAGQLEVLDPLSDLSLFSSTVASITVQVQSRLQGMASRIRCAISEYEPSFMPNGADIANGLSPIGLGQGEATEDTVDGANYVEMHFKTFRP